MEILHADGTNGNPTESVGFPWERVQISQEYHGDGTKLAGFPPGWDLLLWEIQGVCLRCCLEAVFEKAISLVTAVQDIDKLT